MCKPEVVIVGGGPAGSSCAILLALRGHRVLLLERESFPAVAECKEHYQRKAHFGFSFFCLGLFIESPNPYLCSRPPRGEPRHRQRD